MSSHWNDVVTMIDTLGYILKVADDDGMDLHFTINTRPGKTKSCKTSTELREAVEKMKPSTMNGVHSSDVGALLSNLLHAYKDTIEKEVKSSWRQSVMGKTPCIKKKIIYVLTEGAWQSHSDATAAIRDMVDRLQELRLPRDQIGIQFVQFGHNLLGTRRLTHYDDNLRLKRYG